jgi:hypothetical protein
MPSRNSARLLVPLTIRDSLRLSRNGDTAFSHLSTFPRQPLPQKTTGILMRRFRRAQLSRSCSRPAAAWSSKQTGPRRVPWGVVVAAILLLGGGRAALFDGGQGWRSPKRDGSGTAATNPFRARRSVAALRPLLNISLILRNSQAWLGFAHYELCHQLRQLGCGDLMAFDGKWFNWKRVSSSSPT